MPHAALALLLALAIAAINLGELVHFGDGYPLRDWPPIVLWAVLPAPAVYWLGLRLIRSGGPAKLLIAGLALALALALGAWGAWFVLGTGRNESLDGLIVISMPVLQNGVLVVSLAAAWLLQRRVRSSASRD